MMKSLIYLCRRYKAATLLTLLGLGVSVATFYLFLTQVAYNSTYNHCIPFHERTFRLEMCNQQEWSPLICRPIEQLLTDVPHVEKIQSTDMSIHPNIQDVSVGQHDVGVEICNASMPGPEFFGTRMVSGSLKDWATETTAIVTRSAARRLFGTEDAAGRSYTRDLRAGKKMTVTVAGVCEDLPDNCSFAYDVYEQLGNENIDNGSEWAYHIYVRLDNAANAGKVAHDVKVQIMKSFGFTDEKTFDRQVGISFRLAPVDEIYFSGVSPDDRGNHNLVAVLGVSAAAIMLFALLNLLNFTLSVVPMRIRGINTRRVMGASTAVLRLGMVAENVAVAVIGTAVAALLVLAFARNAACMQLVSGSIAIADHPWLVAATIGTALLTGVLSAVIPAWYSTSFAPALVLKGSFGLSPRGRRLRMAIMMLQFCAAFVLTVYVGVMAAQSHYIFHSDYGFDKDEVFYAALSQDAMGKKEAIRAELKRLPFVTHAGYAQSVIGGGDNYMTWGRSNDDHRVTYAALACDAEYLQTVGIKVVQGRSFEETDKDKGAYIVNRTMMRTCNWTHLDAPLFPGSDGSQNYNIVGVCENFRLYTVRKDNANACAAFFIPGPDMESWGDNCRYVFVRTAKGYDKVEAKRRIAETLSRIDPSAPYEVRFLDDRLQDTYTDEFRFIAQVRAFALISIVVTVIGVFCLTLFEIEYRRKEIAIRKVMGSTVGQVVGLFTSRYILPLLASFSVSVPIALWLARQWLQTFTEHTSIVWWLFPLALLLVSAVVLLTVTAQCWRVATSNPVDSIRTE